MAFNLFKKSKPTPKRKPAVQQDERVKVKEENKSDIAPVAKFSSSVAPTSVVLHSYVSEKASRLEGLNQYVFKVIRTANKPEVKKAIQSRFNVSVIAVNMVNMPSKKRTVGRYVGTKTGFRKAIVTLKKGDSINASKA